MAPRASWKGVIKIAELSCPVALYTAASTADRISFHLLNRKTGHRVHREFADTETGKTVPPDDQVKGYETEQGETVMLTADEIAAAIPESDKQLDIQAFIRCDDIDDLYFDRPYYLAPATPAADESFALLRDGMAKRQVAALARALLFRRIRSVLIRPHGKELIATTLKFDYEVREAADAFGGLAKTRIDREMLDLAKHIIETKRGQFDPAGFDDRYDQALADLVKAKLAGRTPKPPKRRITTKPSDLMEALRRSVGQGQRKAG